MNAADLHMAAFAALKAGAIRADNACPDCNAYATLETRQRLDVLHVHHDDECPVLRHQSSPS